MGYLFFRLRRCSCQHLKEERGERKGDVRYPYPGILSSYKTRRKRISTPYFYLERRRSYHCFRTPQATTILFSSLTRSSSTTGFGIISLARWQTDGERRSLPCSMLMPPVRLFPSAAKTVNARFTHSMLNNLLSPFCWSRPSSSRSSSVSRRTYPRRNR